MYDVILKDKGKEKGKIKTSKNEMEEMSSTTRKYELYEEKKILEIENDFMHKINFYILSLDLIFRFLCCTLISYYIYCLKRWNLVCAKMRLVWNHSHKYTC